MSHVSTGETLSFAVAREIGRDPSVWGISSCRHCRRLVIAVDDCEDCWDPTHSERPGLIRALRRLGAAEVRDALEAGLPLDAVEVFGGYRFGFAVPLNRDGGRHVCPDDYPEQRYQVKTAIREWIGFRAGLLRKHRIRVEIALAPARVAVTLRRSLRSGWPRLSSRALPPCFAAVVVFALDRWPPTETTASLAATMLERALASLFGRQG